MRKKGDIYLDDYSGWYSLRDEAFYQESELTKDNLPIENINKDNNNNNFNPLLTDSSFKNEFNTNNKLMEISEKNKKKEKIKRLKDIMNFSKINKLKDIENKITINYLTMTNIEDRIRDTINVKAKDFKNKIEKMEKKII